MKYEAFSNESLIMMYEAARAALASDDAQRKQGEKPKFRVRETPEWRKHANHLKREMLRRNLHVPAIEWAEDKGDEQP
jgi:hypothetical protein